MDVEVSVPLETAKVTVRPLALGLHAQVDSGRLGLALCSPTRISVEVGGLPPLFLFAERPAQNPPSRSDPNVLWFGRGGIYDAGEIELRSGQTVYIEEGATVPIYYESRLARIELPPEERAILARDYPWIDEPRVPVALAELTVVDNEDSQTFDDLVDDLGLDAESADWLKDLLEEDDLVRD